MRALLSLLFNGFCSAGITYFATDAIVRQALGTPSTPWGAGRVTVGLLVLVAYCISFGYRFARAYPEK